MFRRSRALVTLLPLLLVAGCSSSPTAPAPAREARFEMSLELAASSVAPGEPMNFKIRVANVGDGSGTLAFSSGCMTSFVVSNASGVIYDDRMVDSGLYRGRSDVRAQPRESVAWASAWNQETPAGSPATTACRVMCPRLPRSGGRSRVLDYSVAARVRDRESSPRPAGAGSDCSRLDPPSVIG